MLEILKDIRYFIKNKKSNFRQKLDSYIVKYQYKRLLKNTVSFNESETTNMVAPLRTKPHVLFITEKWFDSHPELGITSYEHYLFGSLEASGLMTQNQFHFDEFYYRHHRSGDATLLKLLINSKPDLIVLGWVCNGNPKHNPRMETLNIIHSTMNIPIVAIWSDSVRPFIMAMAESLLPFITLNVVWDSTTAYLEITQHEEKYLPLWVPQDPRLFYNPNRERDIDISFIGGIKNYPDRLRGIQALRTNGLEVYQAGGRSENPLSISQYAETYMRSKIALNFCGSLDKVQSKARIYEATLCGALLMEANNPETEKWFEPMVDFVPFANESDLVEKTRYYLEHDNERMEISMKGYEKAKNQYSGEMFWRTILSRVFTP